MYCVGKSPTPDCPTMDSVVVPVPSREWALAAVADLRGEGLDAVLLGRMDDGLWHVRIEGPAGTIAEIRYGLAPTPKRVCWETFVNAALSH